MKDINIKIRFDDDNNCGFVIDREKKDYENTGEILKLIGILEILKQKEIEKLDKTESFKKEYTGKK